jgi:hypothetical protein
MTEQNEWDKAYYYEYRLIKSSNEMLQREFRCPTCHRPLREGLKTAAMNHPDEVAGDEWPEPAALMCPKPECRALIKLMET